VSAASLSHRPHGSGHPYRYDLDQRVPVTPVAGEPFELRVLTTAGVDQVRVVIETADGPLQVPARPVDPEDLVVDVGPFPARATEEGHLAAAPPVAGDGVRAWVAATALDAPATYRIVARHAHDGSESVGEAHEVDPGRWQPDGGALVVVGAAAHRLEPGSTEWLVGRAGATRVRFRIRLDPEQKIIGLGERYATVDHRGEILDSVVFEQYKHQGRRTYLPVPFAVVVGGEHWAVHVATTRRCWFDLGASDPDAILVEVDVDAADPVVHVHLDAGAPEEVVSGFLRRTGRPRMPPQWVFRPWISANEWNTQARVEAEVARGVAEDLAVGVVVIEAWSDESTFVAFRDARYEVHPDGAPHRLEDFTFPSDGAWPDPAGMIERLHARDIKVVLWQIPLVPGDRGDEGQVAADLRALDELGLCVREADGRPYRNRGWWFPGALLPDLTNPAARRWWRDRRRYLVEQLHVDGFKTDGGEHLWGHDLVFSDGTRGATTNNRFPVLYGQTYHELFDELGAEATTFSRAGFTGSATVPCHWTGDDDSTWAGIAAALRAGLSAGVAGVWFWGWDIAGFSGPIPDAELFLRATAVATFCPIMQYHAEFDHHRVPSNDRTPWNIADRTGDARVLPVCRRFMALRDRLVPYLVEQSERSMETGRPLMRPLCFDHPDDPAVWDRPLQFQLGDDLLVAPVVEPGVTSVEVYLPAGAWRDCFTDERLQGPVVLRREVPIHEIAVFRRDPSSNALDAVFDARSPGGPPSTR